ncbi:protein phosphatase inhibitor 2-like isoform X1 [Portunus trituberculatus]|uniref:protein phosphatase inhibitor 2-like isoform X1 n=2 Tax=Portunus trituberculatus TaxID=210409 RepID=UPI001E1CE4A8|nr:protein phosphatase inhibitor 2-like isoform X1 [Portunus trituberculatus]
MADNLSKQPRKGILKNSSSFEGNERQREKGTKWDEMNILATLHPKDKDYGHMKIDEPKTPYTKYNEGHSDDEQDGLDADLLAKKIQLGGNELPKALVEPEVEEELSEEESAEEKEKRKIFEMKRKQHYNEYYAVKLARKLMEDDSEEDDDEAEEDESKESAGKDAVSTNDEREASMEEVVEDGKEISGSHSEEMAVNDEQEESGLRS